jgi:hypothetical protein
MSGCFLGQNRLIPGQLSDLRVVSGQACSTSDPIVRVPKLGGLQLKQGRLKHCGIGILLTCQRGSMKTAIDEKFCLACPSSP